MSGLVGDTKPETVASSASPAKRRLRRSIPSGLAWASARRRYVPAMIASACGIPVVRSCRVLVTITSSSRGASMPVADAVTVPLPVSGRWARPEKRAKSRTFRSALEVICCCPDKSVRLSATFASNPGPRSSVSVSASVSPATMSNPVVSVRLFPSAAPRAGSLIDRPRSPALSWPSADSAAPISKSPDPRRVIRPSWPALCDSPSTVAVRVQPGSVPASRAASIWARRKVTGAPGIGSCTGPAAVPNVPVKAACSGWPCALIRASPVSCRASVCRLSLLSSIWPSCSRMPFAVSSEEDPKNE